MFIPPIQAYFDVITNRILPTFDTIEKEADQLVEKRFEDYGSLPAYEDNIVDMADFADIATGEGIQYYQIYNDLKQAILNISAVGLFHAFEQQASIIYREELSEYKEAHKKPNIPLNKFNEKLASFGIDVTRMGSWETIDQLRLTANVVKHAEGGSAEELKKRRPDVFINKTIADDGFQPLRGVSNLDLPMLGKEVYLTVENIHEFTQAIVIFWNDLAEIICSHDVKINGKE
jgi:hypothetical protein